MRIVKLLRLAPVLTIAALLLAVPAPGSAAVWKHGGSSISQFTEIGFEASESFGVFSTQGSMNCEVSATMTTSGGSMATITKYTLFACSGTGGLAQCVPLATESKGLPWTVDVNASDLTVTSMRIRRTFVGSGCPLLEADVTWSPTLVLDTPSAIHEMEFFIQSAAYVAAGLLQVKPPNAGTYGIG
jgi:hypothetical protein